MKNGLALSGPPQRTHTRLARSREAVHYDDCHFGVALDGVHLFIDPEPVDEQVHLIETIRAEVVDGVTDVTNRWHGDLGPARLHEANVVADRGRFHVNHKVLGKLIGNLAVLVEKLELVNGGRADDPLTHSTPHPGTYGALPCTPWGVDHTKDAY